LAFLSVTEALTNEFKRLPHESPLIFLSSSRFAHGFLVSQDERKLLFVRDSQQRSEMLEFNQVNNTTPIPELTAPEIEQYLASGLFRGIGKKTALCSSLTSVQTLSTSCHTQVSNSLKSRRSRNTASAPSLQLGGTLKATQYEERSLGS
jgi:hypothetical protein